MSVPGARAPGRLTFGVASPATADESLALDDANHPVDTPLRSRRPVRPLSRCRNRDTSCPPFGLWSKRASRRLIGFRPNLSHLYGGSMGRALLIKNHDQPGRERHVGRGRAVH
jgi:hypothetical protein